MNFQKNKITFVQNRKTLGCIYVTTCLLIELVHCYVMVSIIKDSRKNVSKKIMNIIKLQCSTCCKSVRLQIFVKIFLFLNRSMKVAIKARELSREQEESQIQSLLSLLSIFALSTFASRLPCFYGTFHGAFTHHPEFLGYFWVRCIGTL